MKNFSVLVLIAFLCGSCVFTEQDNSDSAKGACYYQSSSYFYCNYGSRKYCEHPINSYEYRMIDFKESQCCETGTKYKIVLNNCS